MTRYDLIFALVALNAAAIPILFGVLASRWAMACYAPMWLAGIVMFLAGATAGIAACRLVARRWPHIASGTP